jgi:hypothetical protein
LHSLGEARCKYKKLFLLFEFFRDIKRRSFLFHKFPTKNTSDSNNLKQIPVNVVGELPLALAYCPAADNHFLFAIFGEF